MQFDSYIVSDTKTAFSVPIFDKTNIKIKNNKSFKRFAFTLAETLITLTIIGVVAALTIPNLLNKYTKHTYVVGLKKAYAQLQHAMKMIPITEGCSAGDYDCAGLFQGEQIINGQHVNIPVTNIDGLDFRGNIGYKQIYLLSKQFKGKKENIDVQTWSYECAYYANGYPCFFDLGAMHFSPYHGNSIYVDVNGKKAPNKWGKDLFVFMIAGSTQNDIQQGTVIPYGSKQQALYKANNDYYWQESNLCTSTTIGEWLNNHCAGRVLEEDAMNY